MVVTRFAPSPTGYLHVGGARTAIFNWLWARHTGGKFVLRIEDTDIKRNTPTATQQLIDDLRWLGIDWDEGPEVGGPNGSYLQSQRKEQGVYDKYVNQLLQEGKAYYCFDTPEELDAMREKAVAQKKNLMYRRPDKFPDESEVKKAKAEGKSVVVRFAVPQEDIIVQDVVRGEVRFAAGQVGDFIIRKSDGFPTYNFACVVDDYLMKATHVIRGQEHLMNTPGQQALWQALGFGPLPKYAHMSVTVSQGGGKLSKRERPEALRQAVKARADIDLEKLVDAGDISVSEVKSFIDGKTTPDMPSIDSMAEYLGVTLPEVNVVDFFKSGYLPETMVNFLALLGWNPGGDREIMSVDELVNSFDLSRVTKANSLFDRQKLIAFNTEHLRMMSREKLLGHFKSYLKAIESPVVSADDELLSKLINLCEGARTLADIERKSRFLFLPNTEIKPDEKAVEKVLLKNNGLEILKTLRDQLAVIEPFNRDNIESMLRSLSEQKQVGLGKIAQPLRVAICGSTISTPIFESVEILGREKTLARIDNAVQVIQGKAVI
ncbi:MAG: glutamate--tRNA ligase [Sedimentisphaerales bacterium]|nr:glutamate--tRNA ligase [Sedimentisphaerales bacterium]